MVVRLKGGDPFVFGRGGEEAQALRAAGIPYEVVPGITAGVAASAYAGIPVTFRGLASAVALVTGHEDPGKQDTAIDWPALAAFPGTLVFYMGVRRLPEIADSLVSAGRPAQEPAAVLERGTLPGQRHIAGTLATIARLADEAQVRAPSITVVGPVAKLAAELAWLEPGPLSGLTVAVTRARPQSSELAKRLESLGARALQIPTIQTRPLPGPPPDVKPYDLLCLTSPTGVRALFERLAAGGLDARALSGPRIAAIGPGTAAALAEHGILADVVAQRAVAEGLLEALDRAPASRSPRADRARAAGTRAAARTAARARGRGRGARAVRDGPRARAGAAPARSARGRLHHVQLGLHRALLPGVPRRRGGQGRSGSGSRRTRASSRSARSRARPCATAVCSLTSRPLRTMSRACSRRCWPTRRRGARELPWIAPSAIRACTCA